MKIEIVNVRPTQVATAKGTMEPRHLIYFRVDDAPIETIEVKSATMDKDKALAAIQEHVRFREGIIGTYEI